MIKFIVTDQDVVPGVRYAILKQVGSVLGTVSHSNDLQDAVETAQRYAAAHDGAVVEIEVETEAEEEATIGITLDVLRLLFQSARRWWYHRRLRERGEVAEARRRERRSVQEHVRCIEKATVLHVGCGVWTLYRHGWAWLQGYGGLDNLVVQAALCAGVPAFDTTTIPDENLVALLRGPFPGDDPLGTLEHARSLGARVYDDPDQAEEE